MNTAELVRKGILCVAVVVGGCSFTPPKGSSGTGANSGSGGPVVIITTGTGGGAAQGGGGIGGGMPCGAVPRSSSKLPPDILLIQDKSGSMGNDDNDQSCQGGCGANSKWTQLTSALNTVLAQTDTSVNWGIKFFSDNSPCNASAAPAVPVGPMHAAMVNAAVGGRNPGGNTPTRDAVTYGAQYLAGVNDQNPKYLLLATDGLPNCPSGCAGMAQPSGSCGMTDNPAEDQAATQAVADAAAMGIKTFVVGIGNVATAMNTLNAMAMAGGVPQTGAATSYYAATDQAALEAAFTTIVGMATTCTYSVPEPPTNDGTTTRGNISVTGTDASGNVTPIPQDATNGWTYTDATQMSILLHGSACDQVTAGTITTVTIIFNCIVP